MELGKKIFKHCTHLGTSHAVHESCQVSRKPLQNMSVCRWGDFTARNVTLEKETPRSPSKLRCLPAGHKTVGVNVDSTGHNALGPSPPIDSTLTLHRLYTKTPLRTNAH